MIRLRLFCIFSLFLFSSGIIDRGNELRFRRITINDGLSLSSVYCIYQDSKGFMWFGTEDGLNKYDGRNITIYRPDPQDTNSLSYRWIEHIAEDINNNLWFGSRGGVTWFDPRTETFRQYTATSSLKKPEISNDTITRLYAGTNFLWIGTTNGLNRIDLTSGIPETVSIESVDMEGLSRRIHDIQPDVEGNLWIGTHSGLFRFSGSTGTFTKVNINGSSSGSLAVFSIFTGQTYLWLGTNQGLIRYYPATDHAENYTIPESLRLDPADHSIKKVYYDSNNRIWCLTQNGLFQFLEDNGVFKLVIRSTDVTNSLSINTTKPLFEESNASLWFGTFGNGLYVIEPNGKINRYRNNPGNPESLSENAINCIYEDRSGVLWFGTFGAGISIFDPHTHKFELMKQNSLDPNSLSSHFIWSIWEDTEGTIWIGTNNRGVNHYDPVSNTFEYYEHDPGNPNSISHSTVREIYQDSKGILWFGTDGGGLNRFDPATKQFRHYQFDPDDPLSISNNSVRSIMEDDRGNFWIGTRRGLNKFNPETGNFYRFLHSDTDTTTISHNFVYSNLYQDSKNRLWLGTYGGGLNIMDMENETFSAYLYQVQSPNIISDNTVFSILEEPEGTFWIGTNSGLNKFNPEMEENIHYGLEKGLPNEVIYGVLPDEKKNLWISTNHGISKFNPEFDTFKNYDVNDGLQSNEFNGGAFHKGHSGLLYFGGVYGLNIINPEKIIPQENEYELVITKLEILGTEVEVMPLSKKIRNGIPANKVIEDEGSFYLQENISYTDEIFLDYKHRFISLEFSTLNSHTTGKENYAYMMEGLDKEWVEAGNRNYVSYASMRDGTYTFKVKARNPDGIWSDSVAALSITITSPFWKSWWFILLEVILAAALAVFIYYYLVKVRTNRILKQQYEQINQVNQKLEESEKNQKALNATKDKFFSIISHDLKNPFGSLLSIIEMIDQNFKSSSEEENAQGIRKIHESTRHIYNLLDNLLTWSKSQRGKLSYEPTSFNLSTVVQVNINLHKIQAEKKGITLSNGLDEELLAFGDREMISTVIRNLINNAIKFTQPEGSIMVKATRNEDYIKVSVIDNGTGISEENQKKLFKIDEKFKCNGTSNEKGTGLGLILCKEFVEMNGGRIEVDSKPAEGSHFSFTIPVAEPHADPETCLPAGRQVQDDTNRMTPTG
jgi:signal transduction histidine kinase/ligand-binding sensor domain-containing protein